MSAVRVAVNVAAVAVVAIVVVMAIAGPIVGVSFFVAHQDGDGELGAYGASGSSVGIRVDPITGATAWSFGVFLCHDEGGVPTVTAVRPVAVRGDGAEFLGALVRTYPSARRSSIGSTSGFPPPADEVPDPLHPAEGFRVTTGCIENGDPELYTEMLLGFGRVGTHGGGWDGIFIDYTVGPFERTLEVDQEMLICGTEVSCDDPLDD